ncbi:MAG: hypothetical protein QRY16_21685 [Enterobacterales bacterium endosymbiont of Blomia tropicalis]|uniref:hypothetical protein n=1 Tax=Mixta mediterraneensis TaxID=2758443 RepID=UPI0025A73AD2|nr:hypothetical protein [Mixta mediterraneensis]MDL4916270.1 hypothetical protein [Mixta mediterraneensis]
MRKVQARTKNRQESHKQKAARFKIENKTVVNVAIYEKNNKATREDVRDFGHRQKDLPKVRKGFYCDARERRVAGGAFSINFLEFDFVFANIARIVCPHFDVFMQASFVDVPEGATAQARAD